MRLRNLNGSCVRLLFACCMFVSAATASDQPNLVLILADDLGYGDVGFNGCEDIPTPNLDALAASGVRFANGYSSHPFCSPMRAGLMAGRYQQRFGYINNVAFDPHNELMGLPIGERTIASRLKDAGYRTGMVGKWHLGAASPFHPLRRGFDFFYGFLGGGHDYFVVDTTAQLRENYKASLDRNGKPVSFDGYLTEVLTDQSLQFIEQAKDQPYFLYVAYNAPHGPLQAPQKRIERFSDIEDVKRRTYAAMVSVMDDQIGRILKLIEQRGEREKTLVMFLSDNGGPERANASDNGVLRGQKGDVFEGGIHVPFLMSYPGTIPAASVYESPVISIDLPQTMLALAGARPILNTAGVDLMPFVEGSSVETPHDALFWRMARDGKIAIRQGADKLAIAGEVTYLFDLATDLSETSNIAFSNPETVKDLVRQWRAWNQANQPAIFPGYRDYHDRLKKFHEQVQREAKLNDQD
ncbi:MAG: sulfatase-like hydrolase/transferase [Rubripirellula sp.]